ncbi:MAG: integrase arm-type DNA-binding domain-containing protein [Gammaproteobacteria bacterium]|nr:integrase arm-type DNA-binding domain-containing protein [Gammaproteobacteria bacterium]
MKLTDSAIRNSRPTEKPMKLIDGRGLFLLVAPSGGKWWRFRYRFEGKHKLLSLGTYPAVTLKDARVKRDEMRRLLAAGIDPGQARKAEKAARGDANSFEAVAREWIGKYAPTWAESHASKIIRRLERDVFPWIGARPVGHITAPELLAVVRRIEQRGALETAHRALRNSGQVFRYAVATGRAERDPAADLRGALPPVKAKHLAAITDPEAVGALLRAIAGYQGSLVTRCALRLAPLTFVRPGELRKAVWAELDLNAAEWRIPAERMKMKQPHIVPLSRQAVAILRELHPLTGAGRYVFPGARTADRYMSENTVNASLRRLGFTGEEICGHGFRAMARTILDEVLNVRPDFIEHQLAHAVRDPNGRAYNRTAFLAERRKMMQAWADYLDALATGSNVVPLRAG